ncbi:hypothetical protein C2G38_2233186 [Gigaspora rosea]|uniref:C2H2-type domain-containing protein n=1 Tax=Gigaspora rosea TaxID=44941 RepID=A0A397TSH0_9GLOM|nr:hypothetical protein C2G38_2233186 [Gigaspora rosea]
MVSLFLSKCNREFSKLHALTQHVSQKHPHLQSSPNQEVSNEQVDVDIWDLPEDYPNYDSSEYGSEYMERSASSVEHFFMEEELHQMDNDLYHPRTVKYPNDAYREFMKIINKYQLSNSASDAFITFFNKFSNLDISPLPPSTNAGKEFLDDTNVSYMMFKEVLVKTFQNIEYNLWKQYHSNWWKREESDLLLGQHLLSLILYSNVITLDHMEKSSGHPMFLLLGNIPNHQRNKPESKALIGYLPILKAMDSKTKNSDKF